MFLRLLFVLLTALNIAVGAWLLLGQPYAHGGLPTDPDVPELRLLSELPLHASPHASGSSAAAAVASPALDDSCVALGPFATPQDLRNARQALAGQAVRMQSRQEQTSQSSGWWVYLPAASNRNEALATARTLAARNISDYFVVSSGDQANTISLGLFRDPANARKRRDEVAAAGFSPLLVDRGETVPEYWLDVAIAAGGKLDWRSHVTDQGVAAHGTTCF